MTLDRKIENPLCPTQYIVRDGRRTALEDRLQHVVNVARFDIFGFHFPELRFDVILDASPDNIRVLPLRQNYPLEELIAEVADLPGCLFCVNLRDGFFFAFLFFPRNIMTKRDFGRKLFSDLTSLS